MGVLLLLTLRVVFVMLLPEAITWLSTTNTHLQAKFGIC